MYKIPWNSRQMEGQWHMYACRSRSGCRNSYRRADVSRLLWTLVQKSPHVSMKCPIMRWFGYGSRWFCHCQSAPILKQTPVARSHCDYVGSTISIWANCSARPSFKQRYRGGLSRNDLQTTPILSSALFSQQEKQLQECHEGLRGKESSVGKLLRKCGVSKIWYY